MIGGRFCALEIAARGFYPMSQFLHEPSIYDHNVTMSVPMSRILDLMKVRPVPQSRGSLI